MANALVIHTDYPTDLGSSIDRGRIGADNNTINDRYRDKVRVMLILKDTDVDMHNNKGY